MLSLLFTSLLLATTGFATPHPMRRDASGVPASALQAELPSGQTQLVAPTSAPKFVAVGAGYQNYTCSSEGSYTSIGAVAQLFDISNLYGTSKFGTVQNDAFRIWASPQNTNPVGPEVTILIGGQLGIDSLGIHDFVNFNGKLSPEFDFTQTTGDPNNFVIAAKSVDIPPPQSGNVDWLELKNVDGGLANLIFRVETVAGVPPSTCTPGSGVHTVKYAAKYWFF